MKIKPLYIIILLQFINFEANSQTVTKPDIHNVLYIEGAGIGGFGSLNYERIIPVKAHLGIGVRIGFSTYNIKDYTNKFNPDVIIPVAINGFYGSNHKIEFGFGQTISNIVRADYSSWKPKRETNLHANFTIGYRYQKNNGGIIFRCCYTPIIEFYKYYRHWGGVSFGYAF